MVMGGEGFLWLAPVLLLNLCFWSQLHGDRLSVTPRGIPPCQPSPGAVQGSGRAVGPGMDILPHQGLQGTKNQPGKI